MTKIIFRADGNSQTGLGHLYRIFALIEMYRESFECLLLTKESSTQEIIPAGFNYKTVPENISITNEPAWLNENFGSPGKWLLTDGYQFISSYQKAIRAFDFRLACVDDLCNEFMHADVVINHSLAVKTSDYKANQNTIFALGAKYAILRPLFLEAAKKARTINKADTFFVCFGGADPLDLTLKATQALVRLPGLVNINVVLGAAYTHQKIRQLAKENKKVSLHKNLSEAALLEVMKTCDLAVVPASNILYELCAVKMPVLSGYYVENQKNIYKGARDKGIIFDGGSFEHFTSNDFESLIAVLIAENNALQVIERQSGLFDSEIKDRFLRLLTHRYRRAELADLKIVFNWANDKVSRENSYFSEPISLETHEKWFKKKLDDENVFIYIAEIDQVPAGLVRFEVSDGQAVVGVLVDEKFRGKGSASVFLKDTSALYFNGRSEPILAYIKKDNAASIRSFEKAGYKKLREEVVQGCPSFVYELEEQSDK